MDALQPIARTPVVDEIVERVKASIIRGQLAPGDRLPPEPELAQRLRVGRNALREALRILEAEGWLQRSRRGTRVLASPTELLVKPFANVTLLQGVTTWELFEARRVLEGEVAALAAERAASDEIAEIQQEARRLSEPGLDDETYISVNLRFHWAVARAAHNNLLLAILEGIRHLLVQTQRMGAPVPEMREAAIMAHARIAEAIASRNPTDARRAMHKHLQEIEAGLRARLGSAEPMGSIRVDGGGKA